MRTLVALAAGASLCAACQGASQPTDTALPATASPSAAPRPSASALATAARTATASPRPSGRPSPSPRPSPVARPSRSASPAAAPRPSPTPQVTRSPSPKPAAPGATHLVHMQAPYAFSPSSLTIPVGDSVRVVNDDTAHHTFTDPGVFDSGDLGKGGAYTYRFTRSGTFDFVCTYHDSLGMKGRITVR